MTDKIRVLMCEDHALFREGLRAIFRNHPSLEVVGEATNGREAVEKAKTLYDDEEIVARCLDMGAAGYVLKDGPSAELVTAIEAVWRGNKYLSPRALTRVADYRAKGSRVKTRYELLTDREREVLKLLADGLSIKEIAVRLELSVKTVDVHKANLMRKIGIHDRSALVKYAIQRKLIRVPVMDGPS